MLKHCFSIIVLALLCGGATAEIRLEDAWVRAVPPVSSGTAGYFRLVNDSDTALMLVGASAGFADHIMLHSMAPDANGLRRMSHEGQVEVPAGEVTVFEPGARHLMIMGLDPVPVSGESVSICLEFDQREPLCAPFDVRMAR